MHWTDNAIILSSRSFGEKAAIIRLFSEQNGIQAGLVKFPNSKKNQSTYYPGNLVQATKRARLDDQLGTFNCELTQSVAAFTLQSSEKLTILQTVCLLTERLLPEHEPIPQLFHSITPLLESLRTGEHLSWRRLYITYEMQLLESIGFRLNIDSCALTGTRKNLHYISPNTGCAASKEAGKPYHNKLLLLPTYLQTVNNEVEHLLLNADEFAQGLQLTGYFLDKAMQQLHNKPLPAGRLRLYEIITTQETA